ncbi:S-adenosyl-L-methionine-dependent methyltransferase, partial [Baffinella frigidus]
MPTHALLLPKSEVQRARHILSEKNWLVKIRDVDPCAEKTFRRAEDDSDGHTETEAAPAGCKLIEVTTVAERALISADDDAQLRELRRFVVRLEPLQPPGSSNCEAGLAEQQQSGPPPQFTFADLFCGVGGFACGLGSGGFEGLHGRCLLACERDAEARGLYLLNHGTPTFGMSDDTEAPKTLLLENVGNLLHIDGGKVIEAVVAELERCGYDVTYKLLASDTIAGLAQR